VCPVLARNSKPNKKAVLSQGNRATKQLFFSVLKFADDILYKFKSRQALKARLQSSEHTGAQQFNAKWRFKIIQSQLFWSQWKGDKAVSNTNVGFICDASDDVASTKDPQFFRGFQIFCESQSAIPLPALLRWSRV